MKRRAGVTTVVFASMIIVLVVIAAVGYGLYFMSSTSTPSSTTSVMSTNYQSVTGLAFDHWTAIGDANLSGTLSQYSSNTNLWWYVNGSALDTTKGPYTGSSIASTWQKFFGAGPTYWTLYNYSLTFPSSTSARVTADVWYVIGNGSNTRTLYLPYELDYNFQSGSWMLTADWWGLPHAPGVIMNGVVTPSTTMTTISSTTTSMSPPSTTSSFTTSTSSCNGYYCY